MEKRPGAAKHGVVLGKFHPPHAGHKLLIDFARGFAEELTVIVGSLKREEIPGAIRFEWLKRMFPDVTIAHLTDENPQYPHEHPEFWNIWKKSILKMLKRKPDYLFASEDYGTELAQVLDAEFIPADMTRALVPVSGTQIRENPYTNWEYIPDYARPYFALKVCAIGPESTGKTTMTRLLAQNYATVHAYEYARPYLELKDNVCTSGDIPYIAKGQCALEDAMLLQANGILFCDTDLITTMIWSEVLFSSCPEWIRWEADRREYDLYLLFDANVPWVHDPQRFLPNGQKEFFLRCRHELESRNRPYTVIDAPTYEERFAQACRAVDEMLRNAVQTQAWRHRKPITI